MKVREMAQKLNSMGCAQIRTNGSHQVWRTPKGGAVTIVCNHSNAEVSKTVLSSVRRVLKAEGLDV
jgi:predicted RNA binding protein YcfA (HicA-like mRNA interferase family)